MGNSCKRCFGINITKVKYIRSELSQSQDLSFEFENLITNDFFDELSVASEKGKPFTVESYMKWLSDQEKSFIDDDDDDEGPQYLTSQLNFSEPQNFNIVASHLVNKKDIQSSQVPENWFTFGSEAAMSTESHLTNDKQSHDLAYSNKPILQDEEEIDGAELTRVIKRMKRRDLLTSSHSSVLNDKEYPNYNSKIEENVRKDPQNETEHSSIDLDWDHEIEMNPLLILDNILSHDELQNQCSYQSLSNSSYFPKTDLFISPCKHHSPDLTSFSTLNEKNQDIKLSRLSLMSKEHLYYNDELAWDLEGETFTDSPYGDFAVPCGVESDCYSSSFIHPSDKIHLL